MPGSAILNRVQPPGTEVYVKFAGDDFFNTRILLRHVSQKVYFTLDTHKGVAREDFSARGITVRGRNASGGVPADILENLSDFDEPPTQSEYEDFVQDANDMIDTIIDAEEVADNENRGQSSDVSEALPGRRITFTAPERPQPTAKKTGILRGRSDVSSNQPIAASGTLAPPGKRGALGSNDSGGHGQQGTPPSISGGLGALSAALGKDLGPAQEDESAPAARDLDARVLPVRYDKNDSRFREFRDSVDMCAEHEFSDWPVPGPKTAEWCLRFMVNRAGTPLGWHALWRSNGRLQESEHLVQQHLSYCEVLEASATYDQLNIPALAGLELVCRQIQICEDKLSHRFDDTTADAPSQDYFLMSGSTSKQQLCVCPTLMTYITGETAKRNAILKERRKAREERVLAHPKKGPKKGGAPDTG